MLPAQPGKRLPRRLRATRLHIGQAALNPFDGFHPVEQGLVRLWVLYHELGFPVDRKHQGMTGFPEAVQPSTVLRLKY